MLDIFYNLFISAAFTMFKWLFYIMPGLFTNKGKTFFDENETKNYKNAVPMAE